jgi:hypothetical protein
MVAGSELPLGALKTVTNIPTICAGLGPTCALMSVEVGGSIFTATAQSSLLLGTTPM